MKPTAQNRQPSRMGTSLGQSERPTTSNKAAGYSKSMGGSKVPKSSFNMFMKKAENMSKEQLIKELERACSKLLDESIIAKCNGDLSLAEEKCKIALEKIFDFKRKVDPQYFNSELEFGVKLNLGLIYQYKGVSEEARNVYLDILKNEGNYIPGIQVARVRVNIGNIYFSEKNYKEAKKEYEKAFDKISKENRELRANIAKNIGLCLIKMAKYSEAGEYYNTSNALYPDVKTTWNLLLCQLAVSEKEKSNLMRDFNIMLEVYSYSDKEPDTSSYNLITKEEENIHDSLKEYLSTQKKENGHLVTQMGLILTDYLDSKERMKAYELVIDAFKKNGIKDIVNEFEMSKAMYFLKQRDIEKTISIMKSFENKDKKLISRVSNCVSFLYFIEGNHSQAEHYANIALENERYNHKALVNKGNIFFQKENYLRAKDFYLEAIGVQSDCIEAIYNLGMINEKMEAYYEAIQAYNKLNDVVPNIPEVLYKLGKMHEKVKDYDQALNYYSMLLAQMTRNKKEQDPFLLSNIGNLYYTINVSLFTNYIF